MVMKRHMRDKHGSITSSTSPPPKRKRIVVTDDEIEYMDIDEENLKDLSFKIEDMEIKKKQEE